MTLFKTTFWSTAAMGVRLSTALVLNKVLAVLIGPTGFALIGQFQNSTGFLFSLAGGSINNGVVKLTAEYGDDEERLRILWSTALRMVVAASLAIGVGLAAFSGFLSRTLLSSPGYGGVFLVMAASLLIYSVNSTLLAILNGRKELKLSVISNISGSVIILFSMTLLTKLFGVYGAMVALAINQALVFIPTFALSARRSWFRLDLFTGPFSMPLARKLLGFAVMTLASAVSINGGAVAVRYILINMIDARHAGFWDAMTRLSSVNGAIVAAGLGFYYLPRMATLRFWPEIWSEIRHGMMLLMPLFVLCATIMYVLRFFVIRILFTDSFLPMEQLFIWQFAGDVVRLGVLFFAYVLIGREMVLPYALGELLSNMLFVLLSWLCLRTIGFQGVAVAHFVTSVAMLVGMYFTVRHLLPSPDVIEGDDTVQPKPITPRPPVTGISSAR
jgi:PST family polysaccharide transporter